MRRPTGRGGQGSFTSCLIAMALSGLKYLVSRAFSWVGMRGIKGIWALSSSRVTSEVVSI